MAVICPHLDMLLMAAAESHHNEAIQTAMFGTSLISNSYVDHRNRPEYADLSLPGTVSVAPSWILAKLVEAKRELCNGNLHNTVGDLLEQLDPAVRRALRSQDFTAVAASLPVHQCGSCRLYRRLASTVIWLLDPNTVLPSQNGRSVNQILEQMKGGRVDETEQFSVLVLRNVNSRTPVLAVCPHEPGQDAEELAMIFGKLGLLPFPGRLTPIQVHTVNASLKKKNKNRESVQLGGGGASAVSDELGWNLAQILYKTGTAAETAQTVAQIFWDNWYQVSKVKTANMADAADWTDLSQFRPDESQNSFPFLRVHWKRFYSDEELNKFTEMLNCQKVYSNQSLIQTPPVFKVLTPAAFLLNPREARPFSSSSVQ